MKEFRNDFLFGYPIFAQLIQVSEDPVVKPALTKDFVKKMKKAGADIEYLAVEGGHDVAYASQLKVTDPALEAFFGKYLLP